MKSSTFEPGLTDFLLMDTEIFIFLAACNLILCKRQYGTGAENEPTSGLHQSRFFRILVSRFINFRVFGLVGVYSERISGFLTVYTGQQLQEHSR